MYMTICIYNYIYAHIFLYIGAYRQVRRRAGAANDRHRLWYVCICMYVYLLVCMCVWYACIYVYVYVYPCTLELIIVFVFGVCIPRVCGIYVRICVHMCMCEHKGITFPMQICVYRYMQTYVYLYTCVFAYTHTNAHVRTHHMIYIKYCVCGCVQATS